VSQKNIYTRLSIKNPEYFFLHELENGFELSPKEARGILESAKTIFNLEGSAEQEKLRPGQTRQVVLSCHASPGKPLDELEKIEITLTIDSGQEDLEVLSKYDRVALRRIRILRLIDEDLDQEGILTQEDLSRVLNVGIRTIKRDIAHLHKEGYLVSTRGHVKGIGRGKSHKIVIVELYLRRHTYTEISRMTRHSPFAIKRYLTTFARVITLRQREVKEQEISFLLGISSHLLKDYLDLYQRYNLAEYQDRITEITTLTSAPTEYLLKKGELL